MRISCTAGRTNKSVIEEIKSTNPLQLSYFGHVMRREHDLEMLIMFWKWVAQEREPDHEHAG